mgnify:CR=1 FL=1
MLRALFNIRMPNSITDRFLEVQDAYLQEETERKEIVDYQTLVPVQEGIYLWKGDITTLRCGAIVNAANSGMLGCFIPCHSCVDNAIHTFSGVQLRLTCAELMEKQGHEEETGKAKITPAFNLPCDYIIHTVGLIYSGTAEDAAQLADCYRNSLNLAKEHDVHSIAFPAISTGVYGYPLEDATEIAVKTVAQWLEDHADYAMQVIFCCFDARTERVYQARL